MDSSFDKVEKLFHEALALPGPDRHTFLRSACAAEPHLVAEVESLLAHCGPETAALTVGANRVLSDLLQEQQQPADPYLSAGIALGPYSLERKLGEGGMGSVYLATDTRLHRKVAVKIVSHGFSQTTEARERFIREARVAASLSHPNIATVYDFGETERTPWLAMEYIDGTPLLSLSVRPLDADTWMRYATQIAEALAHAHSRGLIHRDIKPANILLTTEDRVKIIDFGLARPFYKQTNSGDSLTAPGSFIGTISYSAPELLRGGSASPRSDVYSLGVVLYEMACREQPFAGYSGGYELISAVLMGNYRSCRERNPDIAPGIAEIIETCMAREPANRYPDAAAVMVALANILSNSRDPGPSTKASSTRPAIAIVDFRNIGGSADLDWLGTGIAETLSADLSKLKAIRVIGRSRVMQVLRQLHSPGDPSSVATDLGRELDARWVLAGGYQQFGKRIRFTPALTEVESGDAVVIGKIDGLRTELFELQDRVVAAVVDALTIQIDISTQQKLLHPETRHIAAYEQYAHGRRKISEMQGRSLTTAIHHFEQAVAVDPDYALAYSGLGTAYALRFIASSNPEDIKHASGYLERAIELDPELGEPYPWLANIRVRRNNPAGAFLAGEKGVELQPDLAEAHYFYAGLHYMLPDYRPGSIAEVLFHFSEAIRLQPQFHAAWVVFGAAAAFLGKHNEAIEILTEAVRLESEPDLLFRFTGAQTLLAMAQSRAGLWEEARARHLSSIESLRPLDHVYSDTFQALSACGLGDIDLRSGDAHSALRHYRHAHRVVSQSRHILGGARLSMRANTGLAAAYAAEGNAVRARELMADVPQQLETLAAQTVTTTFECSIPQLWLSLAVAEVRLGELQTAATYLERARKTGWLDFVFLRNDPELRPLHDHPSFDVVVAELPDVSGVAFPMPAFGVPPKRRSQSISPTL
jgi:eukaryotic-like serine/threonine-protein kinase